MSKSVSRPMPALVAGLMRPGAYPHRAGTITLEETHISWVLLTGDWAYKVKKPVNLGFLDFSSLEARKRFCEEELRLNRRLAPELYDSVVAITGTPREPRVGGDGAPVEYAVKMRQFSQDALAGRQLEAGLLSPGDIDRFADEVAAFHHRAAAAGADEPYGTAQAVAAPVHENFRQIREKLGAPHGHGAVDAVERWSLAELERLAPRFPQRRGEGRVRECHGDLHLGNIVRIGERLTPFDCIEFDPALRFIDVLSEAAFLVMDLAHRGRRDFAYRFLNRYLESTGDYAGLDVLRFYEVYRALVRAKIHAIRAGQAAGADAGGTLAGFRAYIALAERLVRPRRAAVVIAHGLSGSGKTTAAQGLLEALGAIRVRSDVERKRLYRLPPLAATRAKPGTGIYSQEATCATYERLLALARDVVTADYPVIIDAAFLKRSERDAFRALASELGLPYAILECSAPERVLRARLAERARRADDASEADASVRDLQLEHHEPLAPEERGAAIRVTDTGEADWKEALSRLGLEGRDP